MKNLFLFIAMVFAGAAFGQGSETAKAGASIIDHFRAYTWLYIIAFILLVSFFVMGYMMAWDRKLFKSKTREENHPMFI